MYAYPTRLSHRGNLSAEFEVQTGSGQLHPAGSRRRVLLLLHRYERTNDSTPNASRSSTWTPGTGGSESEMGDFTLIWHDMPASSVRRVAADAAAQLSRVKKSVWCRQRPGLQGPSSSTAGGRPTGASLRLARPRRTCHCTAGSPSQNYGAIVLSGLQGDSLIHELTHLMLHEAVDSPRAKVPAWLNEGLAMYFERGKRIPGVASSRRESARMAPSAPAHGIGTGKAVRGQTLLLAVGQRRAIPHGESRLIPDGPPAGTHRPAASTSTTR